MSIINYKKHYKRPYKGITSLEHKAWSLEDTLENMQKYSNFLYSRLKKLERQKKDTTEIKKKLEDVNAGILEVFEKANNLWKEVHNATS